MDSDELFKEHLRKQRQKRRNQIIRRVSLFSILLTSAIFLLLYLLMGQVPASAEDQPGVLAAKDSKEIHTWKITQYADASGAQASIYTVVREDGKLAVIDGGWDTNADALRQIISGLGNHLDTWILTHPHKDHIGAFNEIYPDPQGITIDRILTIDLDVSLYLENAKEWDNSDTEEEFVRMIPNMENLTYVYPGDTLDVIGLEMKVINAYDDTVAQQSNDICNDGALAFKLSGQESSMLFLSDVGSSRESVITENFGNDLASDYVSMAHHGNSSFSDDFYGLIHPKGAFFDAPEWLRTGKEYTTAHYEELMKSLGAQLYTWDSAPHTITLS